MTVDDLLLHSRLGTVGVAEPVVTPAHPPAQSSDPAGEEPGTASPANHARGRA